MYIEFPDADLMYTKHLFCTLSLIIAARVLHQTSLLKNIPVWFKTHTHVKKLSTNEFRSALESTSTIISSYASDDNSARERIHLRV